MANARREKRGEEQDRAIAKERRELRVVRKREEKEARRAAKREAALKTEQEDSR